MNSHELVETPNWDTKQRCSCGADFTNRMAFYKHRGDAYRDAARVAVVRPTRAEIEETIQRERGQDLRRWTPAGVVDVLVEAGYLDVTG